MGFSLANRYQTQAVNPTRSYDVAIIGGGLAGLCLSIQLSRAGYSVVLFEKERYPFHKVCGEYISFESWNFLEDLGIPLSDWNLPLIKKLQVTTPSGAMLEEDLPLGGFGLSRFKLDAALAAVSRTTGTLVMEETKVTDVVFTDKIFTVSASGQRFEAKIVCGTFGKRSNLDIKWKRRFTRKKGSGLNNYIGVKYHLRIEQPEQLIALHNFSLGYCGISLVEDNIHCLCYLTAAKNLQRCGNSISQLEKEILRTNPHLDRIFATAEFLFAQPLTISQVSFEKKSQVEDHVLLIGDAAGMITPLCGNGMSIAMHGSKIAYVCIDLFLQGKIARHELEQEYTDRWHRTFHRRLQTGRMIQRFFGRELLTDLLIATLRPFPRIISWLISKTHGQPF